MEKESIKICLLGDSGVGKSSIINRYINNEFKLGQPPTFGATFNYKTVEYENKIYKLNIWDTAG